MMHARCHTLLCARAAHFDTPLDGVYANVRDPAGFEQDTALSRRLGYRGRKLIHPSQIEPCNRLYAPSQKELDYYARVLDAFDKALAAGSASTTVDGKMIDVAMANAARRALYEAAALKKLFPDQGRFMKEEQRRFELLVAHWDVPLNVVDMATRKIE